MPGMPTFTVNRIIPVVEMLNYYATSNSPRWQAVGVEGSDSDVAAVFSDMADYIWSLSDGSALYSNCINDSITKSIGFMQVDIDKNKEIIICLNLVKKILNHGQFSNKFFSKNLLVITMSNFFNS